MGLFSLFGKNKQESAGEDSAYISRDDDDTAVRARAKRASHAGEGAAPRAGRKGRAADDPVLPEKKRARRRLVGAIALALAVAVGLPMLLDSEPKPVASDIAIQIPSREHAAALPLPASPGEARPVAPAPADTLDQKEQLVDPNEVKTVAANGSEAPAAKAAVPAPAAAAPVSASAEAERRAAAKADADAKDRAKAEAEAKAKARAAARAEAKARAEAEATARADAEAKKSRADRADKAPADKTSADNARALAILQGKPVDKRPADAAPRFVVQVAALGSMEKVDELQQKLSAAGIRAFTHKVHTPAGERIQVRIGPLSREEADKMRARLDKVGLGGSMVLPDGK